MYEDETQWFSVPLITYKDKNFGTDGYLRISLSTNTKDFKNFNPPMINILIGQTYQKSCNLNIISAKDLVEALVEFSKAHEDTKPQIRRKISSNVELHISRNPEVIIFQIFSNETDHTQVGMDFSTLSTIFHVFKLHVSKYYNTCVGLLMTSINSNERQAISQIPGMLKGLPAQILSSNNLDSGEADVDAPDPDKVKKTELTIENFNEFLGGEKMDNVKVNELESDKIKPIKEIDSKFVKNFLKNDLRNLETILNNTDNFEDIGSKIIQVGRYNIDGFSLLPGISDEEIKSLTYVSQILVNTIERSYIEFDSPIPSFTPILKYKPSTFHDENLEIAYDLLLFSGYVRNIRRRLEDKIGDARENKALFHLKFRCFLDPYYFSFLEKSDRTQLSSIIINRFKYYDSIGIFDEYKNILQMHNCPGINDQDISTFVDEVCDKVVGKGLFILDQHDKLMNQNNFRIGSNSNFTKEQIINEIVPLEVAEKLGKEVTSIGGISDEVKNFFKGGRKINTEKKSTTIEKANHLERVVGTLKKDIPDRFREEFQEWIKEFKNKNFVFDDKYPYVEFGDDLIKVLYVWKPEDDPQIANSLKHFQTLIKNEVMEKQYILTLDDKKVEGDDTTFDEINWDM